MTEKFTFDSIVLQSITLNLKIMRSVMSISLPQSMAGEIKQTIKKEHFISVSEFFRSLVRSWMQGKLLVELEQSKKQIKSGQGKTLHSLKDLR